jgi:hypothetical protein
MITAEDEGHVVDVEAPDFPDPREELKNTGKFCLSR